MMLRNPRSHQNSKRAVTFSDPLIQQRLPPPFFLSLAYFKDVNNERVM